jgi:hypothetical protein
MTRLAPLNGVRTSNVPERLVIDHLAKLGWGTLKSGWPDFLCQNDDGDVRFVEVKPNCNNGLSRSQEKVAAILTTLGLLVEIYAVRCVCGEHDNREPFRVGIYPMVPRRRVRRSEALSQRAPTSGFFNGTGTHDGRHGEACSVCCPPKSLHAVK